jgi:hypothetical protein
MRLSKLWIPTVVLLCSSSWTMAAGESATEEPTTTIPTIPNFKQVDQDRNGSISPMEATEVPGLVEQFTRVDRNRDGRLNVEEYEALQRQLLGARDELVVALKAQSGTKQNIAGVISRVFTQQEDNFFTALVRLSYEIEEEGSARFADVPYDVLFNSKVQTILRDPVLQSALVDYVTRLNELLERHPVTPMISDHDPARLHMHVANRAASVAELLVGESLMGLANLVCDLGPERFGVCEAERCDRVFVDTSPNRSRRYCSERCSSRANVAAYRARQRPTPV